MHILWITENYYPNKGGMAQSCDRIVSGLRDSGIVIDLIHFVKKQRRPVTHAHNGIDISWDLGANPAHELNCCWNWIAEQQPQYSHVIAYGSSYALSASKIFAAWLNAKLITTVRGNDFDTAIFDPKRAPLIESIYKASTKVICVSQDKVKKIQLLFPQVSAVWIPNGINIDEWQIERHHQNEAQQLRDHFPKQRKIIGLFGQLKAKKGGHFLLDTLQISGLCEQFHLLLAGDIDADLQAKLTSLQPQLSFTVIPFLQRYQLIAYYLACDFVIIPSFYDGLPNVLLEAGSLGLVILAAATGGMLDVLEHAKTGLLFRPGNADDLRHRLHAIAFSEPEEFQNISHACAQHIRKNFNHQREIRAYCACLATC